HCHVLPLTLLTEAHVAKYLSVRFPGVASGRMALHRLVQLIYSHTEGNPLFMVNVAEYLYTQGVVGHVNDRWMMKRGSTEQKLRVPENLRQMIETQLTRLPTEHRHFLEMASVVGREFSVAAIATGTDTMLQDVETICESLARAGHFIRPVGSSAWPDG